MRKLLRYISNIPGWRTNRKIIVIESDDWGSIRMPSLNVFGKLQKQGIDLISGGAYRYNSYDTLAKSTDLAALFEVLNQYKDRNGNKAKFTAVSVVANPDFKKIRESDFSHYYYEPFTETLKKYYGDDSSYLLWKEGISEGVFCPQFHGREHLNVPLWLRNLQHQDEETLLAFSYELWGFNRKSSISKELSYQAAFDLLNPDDMNYLASIIKDGLNLFEKLFGYRAEYFVPPNGPINNNLNEVSAREGIKYRSTSKIQYEPLGHGRYRRIFHYLGQKNKYGQTYITRNSFFEPSENGKDWIDSCLNDIKIAFLLHKPAIISSHRVNYIGSLKESNRKNGLTKLSILLKSILKYWPDVQFMTTTELGEYIREN
mgnify:FL=1